MYYLGIKVFNVLPSDINIQSVNPKKFKFLLQNFYMKILFILWINILNFNKVKLIYI